MLEEQLLKRLLLIVVTGCWFVFTMVKLGKRNPIENVSQKNVLFKIIGAVFLLLAVSSAVMTVYMSFNIMFPSEMIEPPIHSGMIVRSPKMNLIWGYPTYAQSLTISSVINLFGFLGIAAYFFCYKKSDTSGWKKISKFLYIILLYFFFMSATEFHYFDIFELIPAVIFIVLLLIGNSSKKNNVDIHLEENIEDKGNERMDEESMVLEKNNASESKLGVYKNKVANLFCNTLNFIKSNSKSPFRKRKEMITNVLDDREKSDVTLENERAYNNKIFGKINNMSIYQKCLLYIYIIYFLIILMTCISHNWNNEWGAEVFILLVFILPLILYGIYFIFMWQRKIVLICLGVLASLGLFYGCYVLYDEWLDDIERERIENTPIINRTFLNCELGDTIQVKAANNWTIEYYHEHLDYIRVEGNNRYVVLNNIPYGEYDLEKMSFFYYKDKLTKVIMVINTTYEDQENKWTFKRIYKMLDKKYPRESNYSEYNNLKLFSDKYTSIEVWNSIEEYPTSNECCVKITYYDKTSGYEEMLESGF